MSASYASVRTIVGSDDVDVLAVAASRTLLAHVGGDAILPIWYRAGTREPRCGDRLPTWVDVTTRHVMAARP